MQVPLFWHTNTSDRQSPSVLIVSNKQIKAYFLPQPESITSASFSQRNKQTTIKEAQITTLQSLIDSVIFQLKFLRLLSTTTL